jgi:hypothetical protein
MTLSLFLDRAARHFNFRSTADFRKHIEITLQDAPELVDELTLFVEGAGAEIVVRRRDNWTWTWTTAESRRMLMRGMPLQRLYALASPLSTLTEGYACVEVFLRHPGCARRSEKRFITLWWGLIFKGFSIVIGTPTRISSRCQVSRDRTD